MAARLQPESSFFGYAVLDLGIGDTIGARWVELDPRMVPHDVTSIDSDKEVEFHYLLAGSFEGCPAMFEVRPGEVLGIEQIHKNPGAIFRLSANRRYFGGWISFCSTGSGTRIDNIPLGFLSDYEPRQNVTIISGPPGQTPTSQVLAVSSDGQIGGSFMLRPFVLNEPGEPFTLLYDLSGDVTQGEVLGMVAETRVAVGNIYDFDQPNATLALRWDDEWPECLEMPFGASSNCRGCSPDGRIIFGSIDTYPVIWRDMTAHLVVDCRGQPFSGVVNWTAGNNICGGSGWFVNNWGKLERTGWIANLDDLRAVPLPAYVLKLWGLTIPRQIVSARNCRNYGERMVILCKFKR